MRLSNKGKAPLINFIHTFLVMLLLVGIAFFVFERYFYKQLGAEEYLVIIIPAFILMIFYARGKQIFEYDSDGETLTIKNKHILPMFSDSSSDEFPKYKVISYNILNALILKRLYLTIHSKKSNSIILKYDISDLSQKEVTDLKHSLSKIAYYNKGKGQYTSQDK
ncbi:hypothetical protein [Frigoriflavimonas asaccharolytica]|uniref:Uncharacterized protein n=1 Tax=Frigoriflavimonas asaccharolytica TaxID=2735899 RepID=A0A8J8GBE1_9FLAO|nr:hypothetical protein [Frigoriflavimonas asaccharolytica]NRS92860.1 hypothetical protein [Frigoriflavimonas asaccharolytica]